MVVDDLFGVVHAAVTDFDGVAVKYFATYSSKELGDGYFNIVHSSCDVLGIRCEQLCVLWHCYVFLRLLEVKGTTENTFGCISKVFSVSKISFCNCVEPLPRPLFLNNLAL